MVVEILLLKLSFMYYIYGNTKPLYHSGAACILYSLTNPPLGPSTGLKIHSVVD
jgi:hypothetical protein